jgi:hypothetical protein
LDAKRPGPGERIPRNRKPAAILLSNEWTISDDESNAEQASPAADAKDGDDGEYQPEDGWANVPRVSLAGLRPLTDQDHLLVRRTSNLVQVRCRPDACWLKDRNTYFGTVYRPPQVPLHECLGPLTKDVNDFGNVVLTGDFNVHIGANGDPKTDDDGRAFKRWCRELKLTIVNCTRVCHGQFSREEIKKKRGDAKQFVTERTTVDYVLVSESLVDSVVDLTIDERGQFNSDHKPLVLTLRHSSPPKPSKRRADSHFSWRRPSPEQIKDYSAGLENAMAGFLKGIVSLDAAAGVVESVSAGHAESLLAAWHVQIYQTGLQYIGRKKIVHSGRGRSKSWFNAELRSLRSSVDSLRAAVLKAEDDPLVPRSAVQQLAEKYDALHKQWLHALRKQKGLEELRLNTELQDIKYKEPKRFWSMLRQRRGYFTSRTSNTPVLDESGNPCSGPEAAEVWRRQYEHTGTVDDEAEESIRAKNPFDHRFKALVERKVAEQLRSISLQPRLDDLFTLEDLDKAIKCLKRHAAPGLDQIPNLFLQKQDATARQALLIVFNRIWISGEWPAEWRKGMILPLFKGGTAANRCDVNDYRPITLTSSVSKLFELLLLKRLTGYSDEFGLLAEEQAGFRKGRCTLEQIFTLHEILASRRERKMTTFMAFLDARRAYDRVWRDGLLYRLMQCGVNGRMLRFLGSMLSGTTRHVAAHGACSSDFTTTVGLPQGAVLSPLLYAIFINALVAELGERNLGVEVFGRRVAILLYADDIVLVAESAEQLQLMLDCTSDYATRWQFRFNTKAGKSDVVVSPHAAASDDQQFRLGDGQLHVAREYKYLGVEMGTTGQGCWDSYITRIERKSMSAMWQLSYSVAGRSKPLWVSTAVQLFKALVRPILEYAGAMFGVMCSKAALATLERVQVRYGREVLRLQKTIPGEYVRRELGLDSMTQRVNMAALRFFGRLSAMRSDRLAAHVFKGRCNNVDAGYGADSWCFRMRDVLAGVGQAAIWRNRAVPKKWGLKAKQLARSQCQKQGDVKMAARDNMALFRSLGVPTVHRWLDHTVDHPGAALRFRLRCSGAPLMAVVGGNHRIPMPERTCRMCNARQVEDAEHFVSKCAFYAEERRECMRRLNAVLDGVWCPGFRDAMEENAMHLYLGDKLMLHLPDAKRRKADAVICDFLKVAWSKRDVVWATMTERKGWRLR